MLELKTTMFLMNCSNRPSLVLWLAINKDPEINMRKNHGGQAWILKTVILPSMEFQPASRKQL